MQFSSRLCRAFSKLYKFGLKVTMNKSNKGAHCVKNKSTLDTNNQSFLKENVSFQVLATPVKSDSDKKEYKVIRLVNGLTACLISDKSSILPEGDLECQSDCEESASEDESGTESSKSMEESDEDEEHVTSHKATHIQKMAAAGLCIGVGSFSDPKNVPGMAHFLEHMVFMGSEKFPEENDFDAFIKRSGGSDNASTDAETTCFYFECLEKHLLESLDKFSQFFTAPLMKREAMTREREAIESEFQIAVPSDDSRKEQLLCAFAKKDSPVNSFPWGNLITLRDNVSDDILYKGVHEFRKRHYSAHRMTLAIQARLPLEELEQYVLKCFSNVPNNDLPANDYSHLYENVFATPDFNRFYYIKPIKDLCQINLTWALPSLKDKYRSKPHHYLSYLLGDEGKGSLLSYLKKRVWVLGTTIGNGESGIEHNSLYTFFTVTMVLTELGLAHIYEVIQAVFSYINMLQEIKPQKRVYNEIQAISNMAFKFSREETAVDFVEDLCEAMQFYPPEDFITGSDLYFEYDPDAISMILDQMTADKVNIMLISKQIPEGIDFNKTEKWFGTKYTDREIPATWINNLNNVKGYPELSIPPPNSFITQDFTILPEILNNPDYPLKIFDNSLLELWYRRDQKFKLPKAYYYFYLISHLSVHSVKNQCMLDTLVNLLAINIAEEIYPATTADLSHSFSTFEKGLVIKVFGFNEKLPILLNLISNSLLSLSKHVTEDVFKAVKDKLLKHYYNKLLHPSSLAKDVRINLLVTQHWTAAERYSTMLEVTFEDIKKFSKEFFKTLYVKALVQGNVNEDLAKSTVKNTVKNLQCVELKKDEQPKFQVVKVQKGEQCCRIKNFNLNDTNSIITNYYQSGPFSIRSSVIIEIVMLIIEEPLFDILRTKEQLGYHVYCSIRDTFGILGYTVTVNAQATRNTTHYVDERIESFMHHTKKLLKELDEEEFVKIKSNLIKMKQCTDVHLKEEVDRNWSEITSDDYIFDRLKQEISMIEKIDIKEVRSWWESHNSFGNKEKFRKLSIQVVGQSVEKADDVAEFPKSEKLFIEFMGSEEDSKLEIKEKKYFIQGIQEYKQNISVFSMIK